MMLAGSSLDVVADSSSWQAQLDLEFCKRSDKTVLSHRKQYGPLTVQRAFYPEGEVCHLYLLHPPSGIVGGDSLIINSTVKKQAHALLTTPGATKFYRSQGKTALQQQKLTVEENAFLEWLPQENIYFPGAIARVNTQIDLAENAQFIGWETHCFGLPANEESFSSGQLELDLVLSKAGKPLFIERMQINAERVAAPTGLRNYPVMSMLIAVPADDRVLDSVRDVIGGENDDGHLIAATLIEDCLIVRYLGNSTEKSRQLFLAVWATIRPLIAGREACFPRIWAT